MDLEWGDVCFSFGARVLWVLLWSSCIFIFGESWAPKSLLGEYINGTIGPSDPKEELRRPPR